MQTDFFFCHIIVLAGFIMHACIMSQAGVLQVIQAVKYFQSLVQMLTHVNAKFNVNYIAIPMTCHSLFPNILEY